VLSIFKVGSLKKLMLLINLFKIKLNLLELIFFRFSERKVEII